MLVCPGDGQVRFRRVSLCLANADQRRWGLAEVTIRDLQKSYGAVQVIHGVEVDIEDGQFVVLVGPSGCGKSTLLRMIAGLEEVTGGTIRIGGRVVNNLPPSERDIATVFQNYALYPHKTVASNMAFSLRMRRMDKAEIKSRVDRAAEILDLTPYLDRYPRALSGGQRQRVAMGRDPQVFCSTNRCRTSTPGCGFRCAPKSASCISGRAPRRNCTTHPGKYLCRRVHRLACNEFL